MRVVRAGLVLLLELVVMVAAGCGGSSNGPRLDTVAHPVTPPASPPQVKHERHSRRATHGSRRRKPVPEDEGDEAGSGSGVLTSADREDFARLRRSLSGSVGLTVSAVGRGQPVSRLGNLSTGVAWSTIKAPIVLAVLQETGGRPSSDERALIERAITESDNAAAEALFARLGDPDRAAAAVEQVLAQAGDSATQVQPRVTRPGFTPFGQTIWPLAIQQRFISALPCLRLSSELLRLMSSIEPGQAWGLGSSGLSATFKGGWGPGASGGYLVRQMGLLRLRGGGSLGVTIAASPADGEFTTGTAELTTMSRWLAGRLGNRRAPAPRC